MSKNYGTFPKISIVIPTLNSSAVLADCLDSIRVQDYPQHQIEVLIIDGGSTDTTLTIAQRYQTTILNNPQKTAENGKAIGVSEASGDYIALIDSDNILPHANWLSQMIQPLISDSSLVGSEPWSFTYRPHSGFIERYAALTGINDPYVLFAGNYDRYSLITGEWTSVSIPTQDFAAYLKITIRPNTIVPTIGANGTIYRTKFLKSALSSGYLADIDILPQIANSTNSPLYFAKVKIGIIHTYCEASLSKFIRKQTRRVKDLYHFSHLRHPSTPITSFNFSTITFFLASITLIIPTFQSIIGFFKKPDIAWFFHPLACLLTAFIYALETIKLKLNLSTPYNRLGWKQ